VLPAPASVQPSRLNQSPINHVKTAKPLPTFVVISEYDNPGLDAQGALLLAALCERDRACPRFTRMQLHNHLSMVYQFNTADDALGREIAEFIRRGR
jgi:acetyl esterase